MKIPYYFGMLIMLMLANVPNAYSSYSDFNLIKQIKPNILAKSKPTYTKYAAVSFLKSADTAVEFGGKLDIKSQCGALGYVLNIDTCSNKEDKNHNKGNYIHSKLCSDDSAMAGLTGDDLNKAKQYTTGCCDKRIYTASEKDECPNNAAKLSNDSCFWGGEKKYRCACDRGRYQYSTIEGEWCGVSQLTGKADYSRFNANLACAAYEPRTEKTEAYFVSCCPGSYKVCNANNHEVGRGNECRVAENAIQLAMLNFTSKYEECICAPHYDTRCPDDKVINDNLKCVDENGAIWTPESNCESSCSKTIETNIDSYLYKKIWHCLYRKDGAVVRDVEDEAGICGIFDHNKNAGSYDECMAQGYNKREADCYNADATLRCPNDLTKVWCLEGKYCTGYDVGSFGGINYCVEGANIEMCPSASADKEKRCQFKNEKCNCMWNDGEFDMTLSNCLKYFGSVPEAQAFATSTTINGDDQTCCKRGYKMQNGLCVKNICNRNLYPYDQRPGDEMGELEVCYEGDESADLGYKAYFGYINCHDDAEKGQKWIRESDEPYICPNGEESCAENVKIHNRSYHRCICARNGELGGTLLPFGSDLFFDGNADTSDNYTHIGFYQGAYGEQIDCTDAEGSYYGYKACYIGSKMRVVDSVPQGKCAQNYSRTGCPYYTDGQSIMYGKRVFSDVGLSTAIPLTRPITDKLGDPSKVFCINPTQHCPNGDPEQCDESVKPLLIDGCIKGWEDECGYKCYHINNLVKENGIYKLNTPGVKMVVGSINNNDIRFGFESCPTGFIGTGSYNACFKLCSIDNIKKCEITDVLTLYHENELYNEDGSSKFTLGSIDKSKVVGIVFGRDDRSNSPCGTNGKMHVFSLKSNVLPYSSSNPATLTAPKYPTSDTFKNAVGETIYNLGTWELPTTTEAGGSCLHMYGGKSVLDAILNAFSAGSGDFWTASEGIYRNCCVLENSPLTTSRRARPVIRLNLN